jgi:acyl-homoserine-lactone acylase
MNLFKQPWRPDEPLDTPSGLADPAAALAALKKAAARVKKQHGALNVRWGEVFRLRRGKTDLPASGGPEVLGLFPVLEFAPADDKGQQQAIYGESYVAVIEFSKPVRAQAVLTYGNATQPGSRHNGDQLALFHKRRMRAVWRTARDIEKHLQARERF